MNPWSVVQDGWLYQRGRMGASKHRFFVLLKEGTLVYYEIEGDSTALVPVDTIRLPRHAFTVTRLAQVAAMPGESEGHQRQTRFPFQIGIEGVVHTLATDNADDFSDWFTCLQEQSGRRDTESTVLTPSRIGANGGEHKSSVARPTRNNKSRAARSPPLRSTPISFVSTNVSDSGRPARPTSERSNV